MIVRGNRDNGHARASADTPLGHVDDWGELAIDYIDGKLAPDEKTAIEQHLRQCSACAARLQLQRSVALQLKSITLHDPPTYLEERVLREALAPGKHVSVSRSQERETAPRSSIWSRGVRHWLPAAVAVAALVIAVTGYGLIRSNSDVSVENDKVITSTASGSQERTEESASGDKSLGTMAAAGTETTAEGVTDSAGVTTTSPTASVTVASASSELIVIQDREIMIASLEATQTPAYFSFGTAAPEAPQGDQPPEPTTVTTVTQVAATKQVDEVIAQMLALTGLKPLDETLSLGGPTFAAFVNRDEIPQLVDLIRSIGASVGLSVSLSFTPLASSDEFTALLHEERIRLAVLSVDKTSGHNFTASTLASAIGQPREDSEGLLPDDAGTHVLVVFCVRQD